jgi:hypothetical protein
MIATDGGRKMQDAVHAAALGARNDGRGGIYVFV